MTNEEKLIIGSMTKEQMNCFKLAIEAYRQCAIDSQKIINDMFYSTIDLYNKKLMEMENF